jgi:glycerol-3-phosphate cytidylyltransferase-like family protein
MNQLKETNMPLLSELSEHEIRRYCKEFVSIFHARGDIAAGKYAIDVIFHGRDMYEDQDELAAWKEHIAAEFVRQNVEQPTYNTDENMGDA